MINLYSVFSGWVIGYAIALIALIFASDYIFGALDKVAHKIKYLTNKQKIDEARSSSDWIPPIKNQVLLNKTLGSTYISYSSYDTMTNKTITKE